MELTFEMGKATRDAFGAALAELGAEHPELVVVDGDVHNSTKTQAFGEKYPERFFNVGIAESNLVGVGGGLAASGKTVVVSSFACFIMCNGFDQLRMSVAFPHMNVKVVGTHVGISIGQDGPSQMGIEDIALACSLPGFIVLCPADEVDARLATRAIVEHEGPAYLRLGRPAVPIVHTEGCDFELGRAERLREGDDVTLVATGLMTAQALQAAARLEADGVSARVLHFHTIKPLDEDAIGAAAAETKGIVVAEEHLIGGGLGSLVAQAAARLHPAPMRFIGVNDTYAESGDPDGLLEKYGLTAGAIAGAARELLD